MKTVDFIVTVPDKFLKTFISFITTMDFKMKRVDSQEEGYGEQEGKECKGV